VDIRVTLVADVPVLRVFRRCAVIGPARVRVYPMPDVPAGTGKTRVMSDWQPDERAAIRAFLQRCEVRLSTVHRVATALLSGAGLMVLLPVIVRDQIVSVVRVLLQAKVTTGHVVLTAVALIVLAFPLVTLWVLLGDMTRFYFHAQHVRHDGVESFTPRFTLTGLRLPSDELGASGSARLAEARTDPATLELLVPPKDSSRATIDQRLDAYGGLGRLDLPGDVGRAAGLFELVASRSRDLAEEVAKVEHGMARHILRLQVIVMRYVKALLAFLTTTLAVVIASAVVQADPGIKASSELWLAGVFAFWSSCVVVAVGAPVRWIDALLRSEGAVATAISNDREFTRIEQYAKVAASVVWVLSAAEIVVVLTSQSNGARRIGLSVATLVLSGLALVGAELGSVTSDRSLGRRSGAGGRRRSSDDG
jgi:hypothetical protein